MVDGASPIDLAHFTSFTNGDQQPERELSSLYMTTADTRLDEMREALAAGLPWDGPAHELKGASANLGAVEVAALAAEAETATPSEAQLSRLTAALDIVRHFFERRTRADHGAEQAALGTEDGPAPGAQS